MSTSSEAPLTWQEARARLKDVLRVLVKETQSSPSSNGSLPFQSETHTARAISTIWIKLNLDIYCGAFGSCVALFAFALRAYLEDHIGSAPRRGQLGRNYLLSELVGCSLLLLSSLINLWFLRRRRIADSRGGESLTRKKILGFLERIEKDEGQSLRSGGSGVEETRAPNLPGYTSLTDVYPAFRRHCFEGYDDGSWSRIPTLLLVRGDYIALQVGDVAPSECALVVDKRNVDIVVQAGEQITTATIQKSASDVTDSLPRGKSTISPDSEKLLTLCNQIAVFRVSKTPIVEFLKQPRARSREPMALRQLNALRGALSLFWLGFLLSTLLLLLLRKGVIPLDTLDVLSIALLVAVATSSIVGPACLVMIEALGTSRVLASYHPAASLHHDGSPTLSHTNLLFFRYMLVTVLSRLGLENLAHALKSSLLSSSGKFLRLVPIPPGPSYVLEKLGVVTAVTLVDDELVCEPQLLPQQLLIPSGKGLKLLDICQTFEDVSRDDNGPDQWETSHRSELYDSDSESDGSRSLTHYDPVQGKKGHRLLVGRGSAKRPFSNRSASETETDQVQFEDPLWWQHLPSLKCIGLASLLVDKDTRSSLKSSQDRKGASSKAPLDPRGGSTEDYMRQLVSFVSFEKRSMQLRLLARCIGFNANGSDPSEDEDVSFFSEKHRLHIINAARVRERLEIDPHERDSEESRWWGLLRPDSTSVIVQDSRSGSFQLLTIGDPGVVTSLCNEAWQGENSTILPLSGRDRAVILDTSSGWRLGDLDVKAFSYAPIPSTFESLCRKSRETFYLLENDVCRENNAQTKDRQGDGEWQLLQNQVFLGVLGSSIVPRQETQGLLRILQDAGVRFVFMSPRNMRLTKEIAAQIGIDIAWNAAISLRALPDGEDDKHRMISNYADWDVNAKLPHGIENVRRHLREVDNVPLLVSLFTDVTKDTAGQMIETFQEHGDTVMVVGMSHLTWNSTIFSKADLSVAVDEFSKNVNTVGASPPRYDSLFHSEIEFVSMISAHSCEFQLKGVEKLSYLPTFLAYGRASFEAATSSILFLFSSCLSFSIFASLSVATIATVVPRPEATGVFFTLQIVFPLLALPITMNEPYKSCMQRVPAKNNLSVAFGKKEGQVTILIAFLKALPPAFLSQILYLVVFTELMLSEEPDLVKELCNHDLPRWLLVVRCKGISEYTGVVYGPTVALVLGEFLLCIVFASSAHVYRTRSLRDDPPWKRNVPWLVSSSVVSGMIIIYVVCKAGLHVFAAMPWYVYSLALVMPVLCVIWAEYLKEKERLFLDRAEKLRRLQFETRLGMWSPK